MMCHYANDYLSNLDLPVLARGHCLHSLQVATIVPRVIIIVIVVIASPLLLL